MRERRIHERRGVSHRGILSFDDGASTVACQIVNLAEGGALIRVATPQRLPQLVSLIYDKLDEQLPEVKAAWCMVLRREPKGAALKFLHVA
jgi:hypothetical protein